MIEEARTYFGAFHARALALVEQRLSMGAAEQIAATLFPTYTAKGGEVIVPRNQAKVIELFRHQGDTVDRNIAGTKWGLFNAVTALLDHNTRRVGGSDRRMQRAIRGAQDSIRDEAMRLLLAA